MHGNKIDDITKTHTIDQIANRTAEHERQAAEQ